MAFTPEPTCVSSEIPPKPPQPNLGEVLFCCFRFPVTGCDYCEEPGLEDREKCGCHLHPVDSRFFEESRECRGLEGPCPTGMGPAGGPSPGAGGTAGGAFGAFAGGGQTGGPVYGAGGVLQQATQMAGAMHRPTHPTVGSGAVCGELGGGCSVNLYDGNLMLDVRVPASDGSDPIPLLTFNRKREGFSEFGECWIGSFQQSIEKLSATEAVITKGSGAMFGYELPNGFWVPNNGGRNALIEKTDGGGQTVGWKEVQPDGFELHYEESGDTVRPYRLGWFESQDGDRWTLQYDTWTLPVNRQYYYLTSIRDPFERRTTFVYDHGERAIRRIEDSSGRITTFTVSATRLTKVTTPPAPESCITEFVYRGGGGADDNDLLARISPAGARTSFVYSYGAIDAVELPNGARTTYSFGATPHTQITDAGGGTTSLEFDDNTYLPLWYADPAGVRVTYTWEEYWIKTVETAGGHRTTYTYDETQYETQRLRSVQFPDGGRYTYQYEGSADHQVRVLVDQLGHRASLVWDGDDNRTAVIHPGEARTSYSYNSRGQITGVTDRLGQTTTYVYDSVGRKIAEVNPLTQRTTYGYNARGQVISLQNPLGQITTLLRDDMNRGTVKINPLGHRTTYTYFVGQLTKVEDPLNAVTTLLYDVRGLPEASVNPLGYRTTYAYDDFGKRTTVENPLGQVATSVYDDASRLIATINPLGKQTEYGYDARSNLDVVKNPLGHVTTTLYDVMNRPEVQIDPLGARATFSYDLAGNRIAVENPLGHVTTTVYDEHHRAVATINPLGARSTSVYDAVDREIVHSDPLAHRITFSYDAAGKRITLEDAEGSLTSIVYDAAGRLLATVDALGGRTTHVYDAAGNSTALVDANDHRTTFQYDAAGRNTVLIDPLRRRATLTYTGLGQRQSRHDARGNRTTYLYDAAGRLTHQRFSDDTRFTVTYDAAGNRETMADGTGITTWKYDALNRIETASNPDGKRITYAYDSVGRRASMIDPDGGRFTYAYDLGGRTEHLVNPYDERSTFSYDGASRVTLQELANATRASYTYDAGGHVTELGNLTSTGTILSSFEYAYDKVGNRTRAVEADGTRVTWTYDAAYRLIAEQREQALAWESLSLDRWDKMSVDDWSEMEVSGTSAGYRITHTYDPVGNRTLLQDTGARTTFTYDAANQLQTSKQGASPTTYTYDLGGNLHVEEAPGGRTTHTWDLHNRLTRVWLPSGIRNTMIYNADGLRVQKQESTGSTKLIWDLRNVLMETSIGNVTQGAFTLQPMGFGSLISQRRGATSSFHHFDGLGSTAGLTDASQLLTDTYLYKAYGEILASAGSTTNPFRWVGRQGYLHDADLLQYYIRARHYDPRIARWLSEDPIASAAAANLYQYVGSSPIMAVDPSGQVVSAAIAGLLLVLSMCAMGAGVLGSAEIIRQGVQELNDPQALRDWGAVFCAAATGCIMGESLLLFPTILGTVATMWLALIFCDYCVCTLNTEYPLFCAPFRLF